MTKYRKAMNIPSSRQRRDWALGGDALPHAAANGAGEMKKTSTKTSTAKSLTAPKNVLRSISGTLRLTPRSRMIV